MAQARRGKALRAEPLVGMYEQGKVHHVGAFGDLETQMTEWVPYDKNAESPDRVDALVYATVLLMQRRERASIQSPVNLQLKAATG
jgi:phage terminase large subunit-like protein